MTTHTPQQASDFEYIYNPDGTCHFWYCGKPGMVLAYDDFSPEAGTWFCEECWNEFEGDDCNWLTIVEDRREKETTEEVAEKEQEAAEAVKRYLDNMANDICPHCEQPIKEKKQVGRCVYGYPCGHRLYQGTLPKKEKSIEDHPFFREQRGEKP